MIKKLMLIGGLAVVFSMFGLAGSAYAHFLVEDSRTGVKAILHVAPDDDPIAGQKSIISFDFSKTGLEAKDYSYALAVRPAKGDAATVPVAVASNVILADYTFPGQGFYDIILTTTTKKDGLKSKLQYGQRVTRGVVAEQSSALGPVEIGAIAGVVAVSVAVIIVSLKSDSKKRKGKRNETK